MGLGSHGETVGWGGKLLGGSWVVISRVISRVTILITHIGGLITPLKSTYEPPSRIEGTELWKPHISKAHKPAKHHQGLIIIRFPTP